MPERLRPALRFQIWRILPHAGVIPQTFFLTITNPGAILGLFAIFGGLGSVIGGLDSYVEALTLVVSVMIGSLFWWAVLSRLIEKLRGRITESRLKMINQVAGVVLLAFGGLLFFQLAMGLMGHAADASTPPALLPTSSASGSGYWVTRCSVNSPLWMRRGKPSVILATASSP